MFSYKRRYKESLHGRAGCILRERIILMLLVKKRKYKVLHGSADIQIDKSNESLVTSSKTSANYNPIFH